MISYPDMGLCRYCDYLRITQSYADPRNIKLYALCNRHQELPKEFDKYPKLPVEECKGYQFKEGSGGMRIIGDVHGKINDYKYLLKITQCAHSIQLGDMGFDYSLLNQAEKRMLPVNPDYHKFIPGNHDNYDNLPLHAYSSPYGKESLGGIDFFYVRGAFSIDYLDRVEGVSWWRNEEITIREGNEALDLYAKEKPKFVLSHDCPQEVVDDFRTMSGVDYSPSRTRQILQSMYEIHHPDYWVFGHHHLTKKKEVGNTTFICLGELKSAEVKNTEEGLFVKL